MSQQKVATLGADPELFLIDGRDAFVPAYGKIGGTKDKPIPFTPYPVNYGVLLPNHGFAYQEDGAALEFNIPPATEWDVFSGCVETSINWIRQNLLRDRGLRLTAAPCQTLSPQFLGQPEAHNIGCVGDFCAWGDGGGYRRKPFNSTDLRERRFAGCHLHLGYNHEDVPRDIMAKLLDLYVGLRAVSFGIDKQRHRRSFYGLAGLYREKEYGLEYRTLSSAVLTDMVEGRSLYHINLLAQKALALGNLSYNNIDLLVSIFNNAPWDDVKKAIETEDATSAIKISQWADTYDLRR